MFYVYLLKLKNGDCYVGKTVDLKRRFSEHVSGKSKTTSKYLPVDLVAYMAFDKQKTADKFEVYMKTGSGIAFRKKHLI